MIFLVFRLWESERVIVITSIILAILYSGGLALQPIPGGVTVVRVDIYFDFNLMSYLKHLQNMVYLRRHRNNQQKLSIRLIR